MEGIYVKVNLATTLSTLQTFGKKQFCQSPFGCVLRAKVTEFLVRLIMVTKCLNLGGFLHEALIFDLLYNAIVELILKCL